MNASATRIIDADERRAIPQSQVLHLGDLGSVGLAQSAPFDCKILCEHIDEPAMDGAITSDHSVAKGDTAFQIELAALMHHQGIQLLE